MTYLHTSRCVTPDRDGKIRCHWSTQSPDPTARNKAVAAHRKQTGHEAYYESMRRVDAT